MGVDVAKRRHQGRAKSAVHRAIGDGSLVREPCEVCGAEPAEGHHDDYSKPLEVRWLCRSHHKRHHAKHPEVAMPQDKDYVTPQVLARELGCSTSSIYRAVERGTLPAIRLLPRGAIHIPRSALGTEPKP